MRYIIAIWLLSSTLFSNDLEAFFKGSKDNFVFCRAGQDAYVMLSSENASIVSVNKTKYFKYKNENYYFPLSGCNAVKEHDTGIIF